MRSGMSSDTNKPYKRARTLSLVLLFFLGLSALPAALVILSDPSGINIGMPLDMLAHTPFQNFLIPAILLGLFNGIMSLLFAVLVLRKHPLQSWMILFQGATLAVWLTAEVFMKIYYTFLTLPYYVVAILLLACGIRMKLTESRSA
jgi:hypothetical protein